MKYKLMLIYVMGKTHLSHSNVTMRWPGPSCFASLVAATPAEVSLRALQFYALLTVHSAGATNEYTIVFH